MPWKSWRPMIGAFESISLVLALSFAGYGISPGQTNFKIPVRVADSGTRFDTVIIGVDIAATYGIDDSLGEVELALQPIAGIFDVRLTDLPGYAELGHGLSLDLRAYTTAATVDTYVVKYQPGGGGFPMVITWAAGLAGFCDSLLLVDPLTGGGLFRVDMLSESTAVVTNSLLDKLFIIKYGSYLTTPVDAGNDLPPSDFMLEQNYPNPFNPSTEIEYKLATEEMVTLGIYDALGREVVILVSRRELPGDHKVIFDTMGLQSGVYFYRLQAGSFSQTKKLLLMK